MKIRTERNGAEQIVFLSGRLDTNTAPELSAALDTLLEGVQTLIFNLTELEYVSSAGLRVLLATYKTMRKQGVMKLRGVQKNVMEIFEITGLCDVLTIE